MSAEVVSEVEAKAGRVAMVVAKVAEKVVVVRGPTLFALQWWERRRSQSSHRAWTTDLWPWLPVGFARWRWHRLQSP